MKHITFILLLFCQLLGAKTYYVSPYTGSNTDSMNTTNAWAMWDYAFSHANVGTIVFL